MQQCHDKVRESMLSICQKAAAAAHACSSARSNEEGHALEAFARTLCGIKERHI